MLDFSPNVHENRSTPTQPSLEFSPNALTFAQHLFDRTACHPARNFAEKEVEEEEEEKEARSRGQQFKNYRPNSIDLPIPAPPAKLRIGHTKLLILLQLLLPIFPSLV